MDEQLQILPYIILFLPAVSAAFQTLFTLKEGKLSAGIATGAVWISFFCSVALTLVFLAGSIPDYNQSVDWLSAGNLKLQIGYQIDKLTLLMLLVVTFVSGLIHIFSIGYMRDDAAMGRYFAGLNFFTFAMLGIILSNNFLMLFIFWELVGLSSYLLIGHWFERPSAANAAKKAFLTNRLGDFGFLLGIILIWGATNSLRFDEISAKIGRNPELFGAYGAIAGLLIFCGAVGKSAQFPLHVWLPDAMEGPTPVSALIHAATMVAAGVFMLCRVFFIFTAKATLPQCLAGLTLSPLDVIAWVGAITALLSALIAVQQNDIKRILAYSTLSQLGYMTMAVGLSGPSPAMFHLITHAFFKALLFLCAGSVIIALHHEQDIWKMGGLAKKMPVTFLAFLIAMLAICGIPPFSGFYSKDAIIALAGHKSQNLFIISILIAGLTALYMGRLFTVAFLGKERSSRAIGCKESPPVMIVPLIILALASAIAGVIGIDAVLQNYFAAFSKQAEAGDLTFVQKLTYPFVHSPKAVWMGLAVSVIGFVISFILYIGREKDPLENLGVISKAMKNRFYFDEMYKGIIELTHDALSFGAAWLDRWIVSGLIIRSIHGTTELCGRALRLVQTGNVQTYIFILTAGAAVMIYYLIKH
ncbi:MAG: NADH-quinone oxidoreductase subunit L [Verrucomicrobiia bacterium]